MSTTTTTTTSIISSTSRTNVSALLLVLLLLLLVLLLSCIQRHRSDRAPLHVVSELLQLSPSFLGLLPIHLSQLYTRRTRVCVSLRMHLRLRVWLWMSLWRQLGLRASIPESGWDDEIVCSHKHFSR